MTFSLNDVWKAITPILALLFGIVCRDLVSTVITVAGVIGVLLPEWGTRKRQEVALHRYFEEHTEDPRDNLDPSVVAHVDAAIRKHAPKWGVTWRLLPCLNEGNKLCTECRGASLASAGRHAYVVIRHGTIDHPEMASYVLAHEAHHAHWLPRLLSLLAKRRTSASFVAGYFLPGWWAIFGGIVLFVAATGALWFGELLCDKAGVEFAGADAPIAYFSRRDVSGARYFTGDEPILGYHHALSLWWNLAVWVAIGLNPHHPPAGIRVTMMRRWKSTVPVVA